ncbi:MAG: 4'-phosphopantetheinyl transferase superfamily protein [Myxococcota bacterium]
MVTIVDLTKPADDACLSPQEAKRALSFSTAILRQRFVGSHVALRQTLAEHLNEDPREIRFGYSKTGKPIHPKINFSLSHSADFALIGTNKSRLIGIDLEIVRPVENALQIAKRFFATCEYDYLNACSKAELLTEFFKIWTAKEALIKAKGIKLVENLQKEVVCHPGVTNGGYWIMPYTHPLLVGYIAHVAVQNDLGGLNPT